jgi:hypothetical protein
MKRPSFAMVASVLVLAGSLTLGTQALAQTDPLPSWNDGLAKKAIVDFVQTTTTQGSPKFVPPAERIATFDQDGTLWVEQPLYTQVVFALVLDVDEQRRQMRRLFVDRKVQRGRHLARGQWRTRSDF